jgi:heptosyltransferase II
MRLGIFLPSWIGDTCMATPALRAIRYGLPDSEIIAIAKPGPTALLQGTQFIDDWITYQPKNRHSVIRKIRDAKLDAMLLLTNSLGSALLSWLARVPKRIGYRTDMRGWLLTDKINRPKATDHRTEQPLIDTYLNLTRLLGVDVSDKQMELTVCDTQRERAQRVLKSIGFDSNRPLVVINNAAAAATSRVWPSQYVVHLCRQLALGLNVQVLLHCGPADRLAANVISDQVKSPLVRSMGEWHDLPLSLSLAIISQASVVVSSDSGPRHIATALNRKVVSLFGSTVPEKTQTFNVPETVIESFHECRPCYKSECPLKHHHCMRSIEVDTVRSAIESALKGDVQERLAA